MSQRRKQGQDAKKGRASDASRSTSPKSKQKDKEGDDANLEVDQ